MQGLNLLAHGNGIKGIAQNDQERVHLDRFNHIFIGTVLHGRHHRGHIFIGRNHDNDHFGMLRLDNFKRFDTAHARQTDVQQHQVRRTLINGFKG